MAAAVIVLAAALAYANSFHGPFVFDDLTSIPDNATLHSLWSAWWPPPAQGGISVAGRPVLNFSLGLNYAVSGLHVWSYHALNLVIHALAALTLFGIARRTFRRPVLAGTFGPQAGTLALAIALLWVVHPLQTEAVTYIIQRAESLMGLFFFLTLYGFIRSVDSPQPGRWRALSVGACFLGAGTKEIAALAPVLVLLYDRTFVSGSFRDAWRAHRAQHLSLFATWLPLLGFLAAAGGDRGGTFHFADVGMWFGHGLTQFEAVTRYFWLTFVPWPLVFDYGEIPPPGLGVALLWAIPVLALLWATVVALKRWPAAGFLGAWVFLILAPTSVLPATLQIIVEHRMYLPLAAIIALVVAEGYRWGGRRVIPVFFAVAAVLAGVTFARNAAYRTETSLWADTVAKRPESARAHNNLGHHLYTAGRTGEAIAQYEAALRLDPTYIDAHDNLGSALMDQPGRLNDAIAQYEQALKLKSDYPEVHYNLGNALLKVPGRAGDAAAQFREALRLKPNYPEVHHSLGNAWAGVPGHLNEAVAEYNEALRLRPGYAEVHYSLGNLWLDQPGRRADAIAQYREAIRLKPELAEAHNTLGSALLTQPGGLNEAVAEYTEAIRLKPGFAEAHYNLANVWAGQPGRLNDAVAQYQEAIRLEPNHAEAHYNLGNAWINVPGHMGDVIAEYQEAVRLKPDYVEAHINLGNAFYVQGRVPEAITQFNETLRLQPNSPDAHFNLAVALLNLPGHAAEARQHLQAVLRLQPSYEGARELLSKIR